MNGQKRKFDHHEARRLHEEERWTYSALATHFGVHPSAVRRVCNQNARASAAKHALLYHQRRRAACKGGCGQLVWVSTRRDATGYCPACYGLSVATTVRENTLRCSLCGDWKRDVEFPINRANKARRQRAGDCRPCQTERRRISRAANLEREHEHEEAAGA